MCGMALLLFGAVKQPGMTAYAAETQATQQAQTQSPRWEGQGDQWRVRTEDGKGYLTNCWFQDLDGSWYMLGADGYMFSGIITDQRTGASYLLETEHNGHFGRMISANGAYTLNGKTVYLTFNNANPSDATYGAITSGLSELRSTGISEKVKNQDGQVVNQGQSGGSSNQQVVQNNNSGNNQNTQQENNNNGGSDDGNNGGSVADYFKPGGIGNGRLNNSPKLNQ